MKTGFEGHAPSRAANIERAVNILLEHGRYSPGRYLNKWPQWIRFGQLALCWLHSSCGLADIIMVMINKRYLYPPNWSRARMAVLPRGSSLYRRAKRAFIIGSRLCRLFGRNL